MDLEETLTSEKLEVEGAWVPFGSDGEILVGRLYSDRFNQVYRLRARPHGRRLQTDAALQRRVLKETVAECTLLGWKNIKVKGTAVKFSKAKALELITDFPEFYSAVIDASSDINNFREEERQADLGN